MVQDFGSVHAAIVAMRWEFVRAAPSRYFVATDDPVVFDRHTGLQASPLLFPLSQSVILVANHWNGDDLPYRDSSREETRKLNSIVIQSAKNEIYSPYPDEWIHRGWIEGVIFPSSEGNT
jgi:hypothetical protein